MSELAAKLLDEDGEPTLAGYAVGFVIVILLTIMLAVLNGIAGGA